MPIIGYTLFTLTLHSDLGWEPVALLYFTLLTLYITLTGHN